MEEIEVWNEIDSFLNYQVSNLGEIKSLNFNRTGKEKVMKLNIDTSGYYNIGFRKENKRYCFLVHRLVAMAFIPNPENKPYINHKDSNKLNNNIDNLEWSTASENTIHAYKYGKKVSSKGEKQGHSVLTEKQVLEIRAIGKSISIKEISILYNMSKGAISHVIKRRSWNHI